MLKTETITLAANQEKPVYMSGRVVGVLSCTVASFEMAFDNDPFVTAYPSIVYPSDKPFDQIRVKDSLGGGCTIVLSTADDTSLDIGAYASSAVLAAMAASLVTIDADTGNLVTLNEIPDTPTNISVTPAQTGIGTTTISAAAVAKRSIFLQASVGNAGDVYIRLATPCTAANRSFTLAPGDTWREELACAVYASSALGTETLVGYSLAIA